MQQFSFEKTKQNKPRLPSTTITKKNPTMNSNCSFKENISGDFYERITLQISPVYSLKNEYINPNVFLIMWLLKFEVNFKIFLNFTITHSLSKTFLTISKKQKIPKTLFLAKFKKKKQKNLKLPPSSFLSKTNLRYQFFDHLKWVVRYSICYYCVIYAHYSVYLIVFSARFFFPF